MKTFPLLLLLLATAAQASRLPLDFFTTAKDARLYETQRASHFAGPALYSYLSGRVNEVARWGGDHPPHCYSESLNARAWMEARTTESIWAHVLMPEEVKALLCSWDTQALYDVVPLRMPGSGMYLPVEEEPEVMHPTFIRRHRQPEWNATHDTLVAQAWARAWRHAEAELKKGGFTVTTTQDALSICWGEL